MLLDNVPDYLFWLTAGALSGTVVVGINSTYRGEQLAQLIDHTDCQALVTSERPTPACSTARRTRCPPNGCCVVDEPDYADARSTPLAPIDDGYPPPSDDDLYLLIFTSGSTGLPEGGALHAGPDRPHRRPRGGHRRARPPATSSTRRCRSSTPPRCSPGWASRRARRRPDLDPAAVLGVAAPCPTSAAFGATFLTYTGKVLNYILSVPEPPDDADDPLRLAIGNEASEHDIREFARRFDCQVRDSYGSTEGVIIIRRDASMPAGRARARPNDSVKVLDPETGRGVPAARSSTPTAGSSNLDAAVGEIVETEPTSGFEGYYRNEEATSERFRDGVYWSGDLAYRDADGWLYFAGRSNEWLRVDGENFAAGPVEAIVARHPDVRSVAVYAVPDDPVGDRVMVALELGDGADVRPGGVRRVPRTRSPTSGRSGCRPSCASTPSCRSSSSMKVDKKALRSDAWRVDGVVWRPSRNDDLRPLTADDRRALAHLLPDGPRAPEPGHVPAPDPPVA